MISFQELIMRLNTWLIVSDGRDNYTFVKMGGRLK